MKIFVHFIGNNVTDPTGEGKCDSSSLRKSSSSSHPRRDGQQGKGSVGYLIEGFSDEGNFRNKGPGGEHHLF